MKKCKRCRKCWCGTDLKLIELYGPNYTDHQIQRVTFGSKKCRNKGPKR